MKKRPPAASVNCSRMGNAAVVIATVACTETAKYAVIPGRGPTGPRFARPESLPQWSFLGPSAHGLDPWGRPETGSGRNPESRTLAFGKWVPGSPRSLSSGRAKRGPVGGAPE
jgi:hypothetical protein